MYKAIGFSDIWYKDCFYHALFSAILTFGKNYKIMQVKDFFEYRLSQKGELSYQQCEEMSIEEGLERIGIGVSTYRIEKCVISELKKWIDQEYLIILNVDRDVMNSEKSDVDVTCHSILVYGYENDYFNIMENRYVNSCLFEKRIVGQEKLNTAYLSFINKLNYFKYGMYVIKNMASIEDNLNFVKMIIDCIYKNLNSKEKSIKYLEDYIIRFKQKIIPDKLLKENIDDIMKVMNNIIVNKTVEEFSIRNIIENKEYICGFKNVLEKWKLCRTLMYKYQLFGIYRPTDIEKVIITLQEIVIEEKKLILNIKENKDGTKD